MDTHKKIKFNRKNFAISTFIAIGIVVGIIGISYGVVYYQTTKSVEKAEQLTKAEKYNEAIGELEFISDVPLVKSLGIKKQEISNKIEEVKQLLGDKTEYNQGIEEFNKGNWAEAKDLLLKVSDNSHYYQKSKNKIEELENKITEGIITEAIQKATKSLREDTEEARREVEEAQQKQKELEAKQRELERQQKETPEIPYDLVSIVKQWKPLIGYVECEFRYSGTYEIYDFKAGSAIAIKFPNNPIKFITNKHILVDDNGYSSYSCSIKLGNHTYHNTGSWEGIFTLSSGKDGGVILVKNADSYLKEITSSFPKTCKNTPMEGDEVIILGYPSIGSQESITATRGIISGFEGDYYITDAKIEQGNSGGAAILVKDNCLLGLPTYAITGIIESLGRILKISAFIK